MKRGKGFITVVVSVVMMIGLNTIVYGETEEKPYYTNYYGAEMSREEYENMLTVYDETTVFYMEPDLVDELKGEKLCVYQEKELEVEGAESPSVATTYSIGGALMSIDDWDSYWETTYKRMYLSVRGSGTVKTVTLRTEWKKLTKSRYYDVIGFRVEKPTIVFKLNGKESLNAYQEADGKVVGNYNLNDNGVKICSEGVGISIKLNPNAKKTLEISVTVRFASGADPYGVYATYQHAQKEVSLAQSRKYSINKNGYGGVVKFDSSVASKYDKTEGLYVRWSINEVR